MQEFISKIAASSATKSGIDIRDGKYRFALEKFTIEKGRKEVFVIPELRVLKSERIKADVEPNHVGETVRCAWNMGKDSGPGNVKSFVLALLGLHEASVSFEEMQNYIAQALSPDAQPFRGVEIDAVTVRKINQGRDNPANKGKEMVLPNWSHVSGQNEASVAKNRAMLDGTAPAQPVAPAQPAQPAPSAFNLGNIFGQK